MCDENVTNAICTIIRVNSYSCMVVNLYFWIIKVFILQINYILLTDKSYDSQFDVFFLAISQLIHLCSALTPIYLIISLSEISLTLQLTHRAVLFSEHRTIARTFSAPVKHALPFGKAADSKISHLEARNCWMQQHPPLARTIFLAPVLGTALESLSWFGKSSELYFGRSGHTSDEIGVAGTPVSESLPVWLSAMIWIHTKPLTLWEFSIIITCCDSKLTNSK